MLSVWTSSPGTVVGPRGSTAAALQEKLRAAAGEDNVDLRVCPADHALGDTGDVVDVGLLEEAAVQAVPPARDLVPDLVGMWLGEAYAKAGSAGFSLATGAPDGGPISFSMATRDFAFWVVVEQRPPAGVLAPLHSRIEVSIEERGGGESGDREPRVPRPPGGALHFEHPIDPADLEFVEGIE